MDTSKFMQASSFAGYGLVATGAHTLAGGHLDTGTLIVAIAEVVGGLAAIIIDEAKPVVVPLPVPTPAPPVEPTKTMVDLHKIIATQAATIRQQQQDLAARDAAKPTIILPDDASG